MCLLSFVSTKKKKKKKKKKNEDSLAFWISDTIELNLVYLHTKYKVHHRLFHV